MDYDILIVGSGPSGISTALHLAQLAPELARRTLVLEKAHHPRPKLCAGGLVIDAEVILERLGLDVSELPHADAPVAHFEFEGRGLDIRVPKTHALRMIRRDEFDAWLVAKARARGIAVQEGVTVTGVTAGPDGVTLATDRGEFRARALVGADGSNGVVRRSVLPEAAVHTARLLEVLTPPSGGANGHWPGEAYFEFACVPGGIAGYTWDFPTQVKGAPSECWGVYDTNLLAGRERTPLRAALEQDMARAGFRLDDHEVKGHPIRWFDPSGQFSVPGVLLVGDAAGADAVLGEGISFALGYGALAARELQSAFARGDFSFRGYRDRVRRSPLGRALSARTWLARLYYRLHWRWFQRLLWHRLGGLVTAVAWLLVINWARRSR